MGQQDQAKVKKYTGFKKNGYAKSYTPKPGEPNGKAMLDQLKNIGKVEKQANQIKPAKGKK